MRGSQAENQLIHEYLYMEICLTIKISELIATTNRQTRKHIEFFATIDQIVVTKVRSCASLDI